MEKDESRLDDHDYSSRSVPISSTNIKTTSPPEESNVNSTDIYKLEKVGPIFRIVDSYHKNSDKAHNKCRADYDAVRDDAKRKKGDLYADDTGPIWHKMSNPMITPPIFSENLTLQFKDLPIFGAPECSARLEECENKLLREFVGFGLDNAEYEELENYCNPDVLKSGKEMKMVSTVPVPGLISNNILKENACSDEEVNDVEEQAQEYNLCTLKELKSRLQRDDRNAYPRCFKYRGIKLLPLREQEDNDPDKKLEPPDLEPGKDTLFRIRIYRPFNYSVLKEKNVRGRHSVFSCDLVMPGRLSLTALRDRFSCRNDIDMRLDMSDNPDCVPTTCAKQVFPSGFLFINNVFYVDGRAGCHDTSAGVREWARARGLGDFPVRRMEDHALHHVRVKLAHAEVYVHQGNCEHVFLISEIRLLSRSDPLHLSAYPCHTAISQNQTLYCTTCAEFGAKWLVTGCSIVPFDPAFFCEICFRLYLYKDGKKIGNFKAYAYRGNEINLKNSISGYM